MMDIGLILASGSDYLFLLVVLAATAFLLNRTRRQMARRGSDRPVAVRPTPSPAPSADFAALEVRMHEMARELTARIDSKMVVLQHLIRDAEQQAARLEALLECRHSSPLSVHAKDTQRSAAAAS